MSIRAIDVELCNGCGICVDACPMDVIRLDVQQKKALIAYPEECMICEWCADDCPRDAIAVDFAKSSPLITSWG